MNSEIRQLLERVKTGETSVEDALLRLKMEPFEDIGYAKVDMHRKVRQGAADSGNRGNHEKQGTENHSDNQTVQRGGRGGSENPASAI